MDKYQHFIVEDFLNDEFFIDWVKNPNSMNVELWEEWMTLHPEMEPIVQQARAIIEAFDFTEEAIPEYFYTQLKARIDTAIYKEPSRSKNVIRWITAARIAATFLGAVALGALIYYNFIKVTYITVSSRYAETKTIVLPDHSEVILNAHSSIKYPGKWSNAHREVWLSGEGFFKIKHIEKNTGHPEKFIVHTGNVNVEVLGTQFNIKNSDSNTTVLLTNGSVKCSLENNRGQEKIIKPNDLFFYDNSGRVAVQQVNPVAYTAWIEHKYIFDKADLKEICKNLQHYLGVVFIIEDPEIAKQRLSGTLELGSEGTLIETLSALLKVPVKRIDNKIIVYSK